ncbi:MAG: lipopolysaccharide transport periplasmic protein LptA [Paracoccaceae bacterium]
MFARGFQLIALAAATAAMAALGPAAAQDQGPFGGLKHDTSAPIEVVSDALEVRQAENLAIFTGEVVAAQGTLRVTADKLAVTYASVDENADTGAIQHMRADGNVFVSNGAETAQGAWAEYDVAKGMMHMGGNVVLTQGDNAISGDSLVIDLNTGVGRVESAGGGRVKSVFTPAPESAEAETPPAETPPAGN